ncbi:MAG: hypothetical protein ACREA0_34380 [bacterium]
MRRFLPLAVATLLMWLFFLPLATAASNVRVMDVHIFTPEGHELELVPLQGQVRIVATLQNSGDARHDDVVNVAFEVKTEDGLYEVRDMVATSSGLDPGQKRDVEYVWVSQRLGNHSVVATVEGVANSGFLATFRVTETAVPAGGLGERILDYWWFFGSFAATCGLFVAVLRTRRT